LLARGVIKRHLKLHLTKSCPDVAVHTFPSLESDDFRKYLLATPIHFVMIHDGSGRTAKAIQVVNGDDPLTSTPQHLDGILVKTLLRGMIWYFNIHKLNVALINRIEFQDSKLFTMIVESFLHEIAEKRGSLRELRDIKASETDVILENDEVKGLREAFSEEDLTETDFLVAHAVSKLLKAKKCDIFMASALVLHTVLLRFLPLSERRFPLVMFSEKFEQQVDDFITQISNTLRLVIDDPRWSALMGAEEVETDAIDLIDGRLFRVVMQAMCDKSIKNAVPTAARPDWATICSIVAELTGEKLSLEGSSLQISPSTTSTDVQCELEPEALAVLPFSNTVFDKHLECIHVNTDSSISARLGAMKVYREPSHWHNYKKPINPKLAPVEKVSKWRWVPKFYLLSYAKLEQKSLEAKPVLHERNDILCCKLNWCQRESP